MDNSEICAGCGKRTRTAGAGAIYIPASGGPAVIYILCPRCAEKVQRSPRAHERVMARVETACAQPTSDTKH